MAIVLYNKSGEFKLCDPFSYLHLLDEGWFYTHEEALKAAKEKIEKEEASEKEDIRDKSRPFIAKYSDQAPETEVEDNKAKKAKAVPKEIKE